MKLAERKLLINESPFRDVDFLEERKQRRCPHILAFEEEDRMLAAALPHIRALAVLILETGKGTSATVGRAALCIAARIRERRGTFGFLHHVRRRRCGAGETALRDACKDYAAV